MQNNLVRKSAKLAQKVYSQKFRGNGENYYEHIARSIEVLKSIGIDDKVIFIATYLNYALEINPNLESEIKKIYGDEVLSLIKSYRNLANGPIKDLDPKKYDQGLLIKTFLNIAKDPRALIIRLAIKVDNVETVYSLPKEISTRIAERALYLYAPICKLLGFYTFVRILEDCAFKILNPGEYYRIFNYLNTNLPEINKTLLDIKTFIEETLREKKITCEITFRTKHIFSIYSKSQKYLIKNGKTNLREIKDIAAMRIMVITEHDCYLVEDILKQIWDIYPEERDDYISKPKPSGYKSIHNVYKISKKINLEIQIRTFEMHQFNEFGVASHVAYKLGENIKKRIQEDPNFLKLLNVHIHNKDIKIDAFNKNIYVFTPKGDIKELPRGSTVLDFAYHIHRDLGNTCIGGIVNGIFHSGDFQLDDGDRVIVKVSPHKKNPSHQWLKVVKTKRARDEIKKALRELKAI